MGDDSARGIYRVQVSGRTLCNGSVPIPLPVLWRQSTYVWRRANADAARSPLRSRKDSQAPSEQRLAAPVAAFCEFARAGRSGRKTVYVRIYATVASAIVILR